MSRRLSAVLCRLHERNYCHLVGSGTAGLALALEALGSTGTRVAIPNSVCPNVPIAVYLARATPVYCDVSPTHLGLDVEALACSAPVQAVVGVHAYGALCDVTALERHCADRGIPMIEDAALAQGASLSGRPAGSFGAVSILSFGVGKVVSTGIGGAVLTDDKSTHAAVAQLDSYLPAYSSEAEMAVSSLGHYHTWLYNRVYLAGEYERLPQLFKPRALASTPAILHQFPAHVEPEVCERIERIEQLVDNRWRNLRLLLDVFRDRGDLGIQAMEFPPGSVPWRCNLLISARRDALLRSLLADRVAVSSWYPSADLFFESRRSSLVRSPVADELSSKLLNLWIDESADADYFRSVSHRIIDFLS